MSTKTEPPDPVSPSDESDMSADMPDVELGLGTEGTASEQLERIRSKLSLQDQSSRLPLRQILIIFFGLAIAMFLAFLDMTTVSTALPTIARDFNASTEVSWVGTSFLIANTSMQILYGRLSDVFGRKVVLMSAIGLFAVGNLLCGFSQSMVWSRRRGPLIASFNLLSFVDCLELGEEGLSV
jgi:Major Facilitator Superfamily